MAGAARRMVVASASENDADGRRDSRTGTDSRFGLRLSAETQDEAVLAYHSHTPPRVTKPASQSEPVHPLCQDCMQDDYRRNLFQLDHLRCFRRAATSQRIAGPVVWPLGSAPTMRALHLVQQSVDASAIKNDHVVHDGARLWQHVVPQPLWPEGEAAQPATRMPGKMSVRHSETNPVPPEVRVLDHGLRVHHYRPVGKVCRGIVVLAPGGRGGMGPGELSPSGGQASPRAGSSTTMSAGLFSPSIVSVFTRLGVSLTKEGIAVCHLTWRSPPMRPGASRDLLHKVKTLREAQLEIEAAVRFMRTVHELDSLSPALPLVLVGFCFGGAAALAAAATSLRSTVPVRGPPTMPENKGLGPLAGVLGMGLALRIDDGSPTRSYADLDTFNCVPVLARAAVPLLLLHGTSDELIGATAASLLFDAIEGPKAAGWLVGAEHDLISRHEAAHQTAHAWILGLLHRSRVCGGMLMQMQPPKESEEGIPFGRAVTF